VTHSGDNLTGEGEGDDEQITVKVSAIPAKYKAIFFVIEIYTQNKTFAQVKNPFVRVVDGIIQKQLVIFYPKDIANSANALIVGAIVREPNGWTFRAMGHKIAKHPSGAVLLEEISVHVARDTRSLFILKARDLKSADSNGLSDPYAKVLLLGKKYKTKTHKKTLNPEWGLQIEVPRKNDIVDIHVEVWDWDAIGSDDFLGEFKAQINLTKVGEQWIALKPRSAKDKGIKGEVCIKIQD